MAQNFDFAESAPREMIEQGEAVVVVGTSSVRVKRTGKTEEWFSWLHTGDIARADERGYMFILDRKKEMIVTGGFNVFPREVEDALATHPDVAVAAVIGIPDDQWGKQSLRSSCRSRGQNQMKGS